MKEKILSYLNNPAQLEKLYRKDKTEFKRAFISLYPEIKDNLLADYWNERLNFNSEEISWGNRTDLIFVIIASLIAGFIAELPKVFSINEEYFYPRNIGFIVLPILTGYFAWKNKLSAGKIAILSFTIFVGLIFINLLPDDKKSDTLMLSCIHLVLLLWSVMGVAFVGGVQTDSLKRLAFLKYNGDLIVMTTLIVIAGGIMSGVTIGLFSLIGFDIAETYMQYVGVFGIAAAPIVGTYITRTNPHLVGKVSPVIAKIFSPLVLVMLVIYVVAIMWSGKSPFHDREFLLIFNALLVAVMALIFFSIAGTSVSNKSRIENWILLALSIVTIVVNGIALSAIVFRISEWGVTPNRVAVLGSNILILVNLVLVAIQLSRVISKNAEVSSVGNAIARYLPLYCIWTIIVTFIFPFVFGYK